MAITQTAPVKTITKVALEPGMKIALAQNGVTLTAEHLGGKSLAVTKSGDSLMVTMPDGSQTELVDFFITEEVELEGDFWDLPADSGLVQTASGIVTQPEAVAQAADTGVLGEEAISTDANASEIAEGVAEVVAETVPTIASNSFGAIFAGIAGLGVTTLAGANTANLPDTILSVGIYAGPLIAANQLTIAVFGADSELLQAAKAVELVDGRVTVTFRGDYRGPVLLKVVDTDSGHDYINEVDGEPIDLSVDLRAIVQIDDASQGMNVNISLLTELVVQEIIQDAGGDEGASASDMSLADSEMIAVANTKIAKALNLHLSDAADVEEIALMDVRTTVNADRTVVTEPNKIGQILAAISGYEMKHTGGTAGVLSALKVTINSDAESDVLKGETMSLLGEGARWITVGNAMAIAQAIDTIAPTVAIRSSGDVLKAGETVVITFSFTEDPGTTFTWDGVDGDVFVSGGTLSPISGSGLTRSAVFTPTADLASGTASIRVASDTYTDAAGNGGSGSDLIPITFDTLAPTLVITSDVTALKVGETATITFTFSEEPGNTFAWDGTDGDLVVSGGTLSALSGSGLTREGLFTPAVNPTDPASITVGGNYTDAAGNTGGAGSTPSITIDTIAPTITITCSASALKIGETATVTFKFSEAPIGFTNEDVTLVGGTLNALTVDTNDASIYTAIFTPAVDSKTAASITVSAGYTDEAGNAGIAGITPSITIDTIAPTVAITGSASALKIGETAVITFTFSEAPVDFTTDDVAVAGGMLSALTVDGGDAKIYTATFTPAVNSTDPASITVGESYTDAAGNAGVAGVTPSITIDTIAPTLTITSDVTVLKIGETAVITFTFSEAPVGFTTSDVDLAGSGTLSTVTVDETDPTIYTATFTPSSNTTAAASITVTTDYTDTAGNPGVAGATPVIAIDTAAPTVSAIAITSADGVQNSRLNAGDVVSVTVTMSEAVTVANTPQLGLVIGTTPVSADYASGSGTTELTFTYMVLAGQTDINGISISADALTLNSGTIVDAAGNAATLTHNAVVDNGGFLVDTTAPVAPPLALGAGVSTGASSAEATAGAVTVDAELDASVAVTFTSATDPSKNVTKTVAGTGSAQAVRLEAEDLIALGEGTINVSAVATDQAGNPSEDSTASFDLDTTAPTITTTALSVAENTTMVGNLVATDTNSVTWSFVSTSADEGLFSIASDGTLTLNDATNFEARSSYAIDAIATDTAGNSSTQSIAVTVTDVNEAPTYVGASGNDSISIANGSDVNIDLQSLFNDPEGDTLTYTVGAGNPLPGTLVLSSTGGVISGTAARGTYDGIIINVSDNTLSVEHTFLLDVVV
jgi:hypothetical protein